MSLNKSENFRGEFGLQNRTILSFESTKSKDSDYAYLSTHIKSNLSMYLKWQAWGNERNGYKARLDKV